MIKLKLDPCNMGQALACCGIFELCELKSPKSPGSVSCFKKKKGGTDFCLETKTPLSKCIHVLKEACVCSPHDISHTEKRGLEPLNICTEWGNIRLNWWLNPTLTDRSEFKTWSGNVTPSKLINKMREELPDSGDVNESMLMNYHQKLDSRFGFDANAVMTFRKWGFYPSARQKGSPIGKMKFVANPILELLAAIAFQTFRPKSVDRNKYEYGLWGWRLPLAVARLAFACKLPVGDVRKFETASIRVGSAKGFEYAAERFR